MTSDLPAVLFIPHDDLQKCVGGTAVVSPVNRLPNELLVEIFELICSSGLDPDADIRDISLVYPSGRTALRLGLVCSRWRDVALRAPRLWMYIIVCVCDHKDLYMQTHPIEEVLELYLLRSQTHPLAIYLDCFSTVTYRRQRGPTFQDEHLCDHLLSSTLRVLSQASVTLRWQYAHINLPHADQLDIWPRSKSVTPGRSVEGLQAPLLEFLHIEQETTYIPFSSIPELHTLVLSATPLSNFLYPDLLKAPSLRSLVLRSYLNSDLKAILPTLRPGLEVTIEDFHPDEESSSELVGEYQCPLITLSIHLIYTGLQPAALLCRNLIAPHLTTLELVRRPCLLSPNGLVWAFPLAELIMMLRQSSPPLTSLRIEGFAVMDIHMLNLLLAVPTLTRFIYADPPQDWFHTATPVFFRSLTQGFRPSDTSPPLFLPSLKHIDLTLFPSPFSNPQPLLDMIRARGKLCRRQQSPTLVARLESVKLTIIEPLLGSSLWAALEDALTELKENGLSIRFRRATNSGEVAAN